uniref:3-beta hydroxysteroid dehydrogenase/isomerase domain-containing protein n=1 Tax=Setaria italica TaxID=4555 RepID=K4AFZ0_SETIT
MVVCFGCGGYQVRRWRADDKAETDHLLALAAGAGEGRLSIFRCDLFDGAALLDAARGCPGVFHLASPCIIDAVSDPQVPLPRPRCPLLRPKLTSSVWLWPQKQLMVPAVEGTLNVLRAAKEAGGVRRVVVTSSISAIVPSPGWPAGEVRDGRCWTDVDYCEENGVPQG